MKKIITILLLVIIFSPKYYWGKNDTTITLLNNRLVCSLKKGYTKVTNQNLMGPEPSNEKEEYLKLTEGTAELTIYVNELFVRTSKNTKSEIQEHIKTWKNGEVTYSLSESDKLKSNSQHFIKHIIKPDKIVSAENSLYRSVFIENFDNTLISLGFYLNDVAIKDQKKWEEIIDHTIKSILPGSRKISSRQKIAVKTISDKTLELSLTENYGVIFEKGYGMFVTNITQISSLSEMPSKLTIYSGMHPSEFFKEQSIDDNELIIKKINIGAEKLVFKTFTNGKIWAAECLYKLGKSSYIHFILFCYNETVFNEMFDILEKGELK